MKKKPPTQALTATSPRPLTDSALRGVAGGNRTGNPQRVGYDLATGKPL